MLQSSFVGFFDLILSRIDCLVLISHDSRFAEGAIRGLLKGLSSFRYPSTLITRSQARKRDEIMRKRCVKSFIYKESIYM